VIVIEPARPADAGEILTVQRAAYVTEAQRYGDPRLPPLTETLAEVEAAVATATVLVARDGGRLVGVVRGRLDGDGTCHVGRLAVAPDRQGGGVGGRLLDAIEAAHAGRAGRFELFTGAASDENVRLYERRGYAVCAHRALHNGPGLVFLDKRVG
jgi:GNAT superfamily N-acetyltransferase